MIGLRLENDSSNGVSGQLKNRRSHKFVERLQGRFFVAGVSGSFQKYTKLVAEINAKEEKADEKKVSEPYLVRKQRLELANDAKRLLEIEQKLEEINRRKVLRKKRDEQRRQNKLELTSIQTIQRAYRKFVRNRRTTAVTMILAALRYTAAKQAISAKVWAIKILRKFFRKIMSEYKARRVLQEEIQLAAQDCWLIVSEVACVWTASRRRVADEMVHASMKSALTAVSSLIAAKTKKPLRRQNTKKKLTKSKTAKNASSLAFFMTECDGQTAQPSDDESSDGSSTYGRTPVKPTLVRQKTNRSVATLPEQPTAAAAVAVVAASSSTKHSASTPALHKVKEPKEPAVKPAAIVARDEPAAKPIRRKSYDDNDAKVARLKEIHKNKINQMEAEKQRRIENISESKVKREQEQLAEQLRLKQEREQQEKAKLEFIKRLEQEQATKQAAFKAALQIRQKEEKLQASELALMAREDRLSKHCRTLLKLAQKPPSKASAVPTKAGVDKKQPSAAPSVAAVASVKPVAVAVEPPPVVQKKPYVPRQAISAAKIAEIKAKEHEAEELELLEFKRQKDEKFNSEEAIKRNREAVQRRVAARLARAAQQQQEKEAAEKELKLKLDQVANESKKHLAHVLTRDQAVKKYARSKLKPKRKAKAPKQSGAHDILISDDDEENESDEEHRKQEYMRIISSAKEDFPVGEGDFEIEDFFDQTTLMQLYVAPTAPPVSSSSAASLQELANKPPSPVAVVVSKKVLPAVPNATVSGPGKPKTKATVNIPKFLRNTPYFVDYEKHTEVAEVKPSGVKQQQLNRKNTPPFNAGVSNNNNNGSPGESDDFHFVKKSHGKVASLIETISEARKNSADPKNAEEKEQQEEEQPQTIAGPTVPPPIETKGLTDLKIPPLGSTKYVSLASGTHTRTPATNSAAAPISFKFAPPNIPLPTMSENDLKLLRSVKKRPSEVSAMGVSSKSTKQPPQQQSVSGKEKSGKTTTVVSSKNKAPPKQESDSEEDNEAAEELKLLNDYAVLKQRLTASFNADNDRRGMSHENLPLDNDQDTLVPRSIKMPEDDEGGDEMLGGFDENFYGREDAYDSERSDYDDDVAEQEEGLMDEGVLNEMDEREDLQSDDGDEREEEDQQPRQELNLDDDDCMQLLQNLTAKINK